MSDSQRHARPVNWSQSRWPALLAVLAIILGGCAKAPQVQRSLDYEAFTLQPGDLRSSGVAFLTPSSVTGREQDRPTIAFLFSQVLREQRPDIPVTTLAETLSEINEAGLEDRMMSFDEFGEVVGLEARYALDERLAAGVRTPSATTID